jgi:hypothetical protein
MSYHKGANMIKELSHGHDGVLGFEITGKVTLEEEKEWIAGLEDVLKIHEKLRVLILMDPDSGWTAAAGVEDIKWIIKHMKNFEKIALVSDSSILKLFVSIDSRFAKLAGIGEKHFETCDIEKAWEWLKA